MSDKYYGSPAFGRPCTVRQRAHGMIYTSRIDAKSNRM